LAASIERLHRYLASGFPFSWRITILDNASTDATWDIAGGLAARFPRVQAVHLSRKGRGIALRRAWLDSDAKVLVYTDVDLSTDLDALLPLVAPLVSGHSEVATGSRLTPGAVVARGPKRELISRTYNVLLRLVFATRFRDAQCGFKAIRGDVARQLIPEIADDGWFFDTELLLLAEHNGLRVHEVPVDWVDNPDTRVHVGRTIVDDLRGMARMAWRFMRGGGRVDVARAPGRTVDDDLGRSLVSFMTIGAMSTAVSLALFLLLREPVGAIAANALAVTATFVANTWANRHWTLGGRVRRHHWWGAVGVYAASVAVTSIALAAVHAAGGGLGSEILTLVVTWAMAAIGRLGLIRSWSSADNRPRDDTSQLRSVG
jgi:putative flippase GtrA